VAGIQPLVAETQPIGAGLDRKSINSDIEVVCLKSRRTMPQLSTNTTEPASSRRTVRSKAGQGPVFTGTTRHIGEISVPK
jgi:hypothetical protein